MPAESSIQIIEASAKWRSANMGIEDSGSVLTSQRFQGRNDNLPPIRSGSAPPSMEGSFAAVENLLFRKNLAADANPAIQDNTGISEYEEQLRADPSYLEYYLAHVNLNPRLPTPLISGENRNLFHNVRGTNTNSRLTSFADPSSRSIWLDRANLSTHDEESGSDRSLTQEDLPQAPNVEAGNYADSNSTTTTVSSSPSRDRLGGNMVVNPPVNTSLNTHSQDHGSLGGVTDADISAISNGMASLDIPNSSKLENENAHAGPHPQTMPLPQPYVGTNQYSQIPAILLPHYASHPGYMTSETLLYPNMMPAGYFPQQYAIGGYAFNPPPVFPYAAVYLPNNPLPKPVGNMVPSSSGQSQTSGVNVQQVNNLPYYLASPTNVGFLQYPNPPFASPSLPESPIRGVSYPGGINESVYNDWQGHTSNCHINHPKTNSLLEQLKKGRGRTLELSEVYGHIVEFSVDQVGSRFIQQNLEVCSDEEMEAIFKEVLPHASKLITDVFGNYVIQKILEHGNAEQRRGFGKAFEGQILPLSLQKYGCRVIQKALEVFEQVERIKIFHELEGHILKCVRDQNGNHVIQKCIEYLPTENFITVLSSLRGQVVFLARHPYGCRFVQMVLEQSKDKLQSQFIVDELLAFVYDLAQDEFGNYVIQYVLKAGKSEDGRGRQIVDKLVGHIVRLSQHKFASNVIEKCLEYGDKAAKKIIIEEITGYAYGNDNLLVMLKDKYANYVVQKALQICKGHQREVLLSRMKVHLNLVRNYTYGKHTVARFEQLYSKETQASGSNSHPMSDDNL